MSGAQEPNGEKRGRGGAQTPVTAKTRAKIRRLARLGTMSQNAVAKACGVSRSTVGKVCREAKPQIHFDRSATAAASAAHAVDLKAARLELSEKTVAEARYLFEKMRAPHEVHHFDKDGFVHWARLEGPTSGDVKNYAIAIGILIQRHADLIKLDSDDRDLAGVDLWLAQIRGVQAPVPAGWE